MAIDIVGHINQESSLSQQDKLRMLNSLASAFGYKDGSGQTKKDFVNEKIVLYLRRIIKNYEIDQAQKEVVVEEIGL